ncbi:MAG TPA: phosphatase PAP2 family protein [Polyangiaceae bacterium]|nr:phosphatase PAP2 family protein [Polyangiaceae bacterium]
MRRRYLIVLLGAYMTWLLCYELVGHLAARLPTSDLTTSWDRAIPLWPPAVWAYESCYLLPFVPVILARDWHRINVWLLACLLANLSAFVVYFALPVAFPRPALGDGWAERVIAWEYAIDFKPGANNLPSMHVALSWLAVFGCARQGRSPWLVGALGLLAALISLSTLFVKQHLVWDVVAGVIWALASWAVAGAWYGRRRQKELSPLNNLRRTLGFSHNVGMNA